MKFEKVSLKTFIQEVRDSYLWKYREYTDEELEIFYNRIQLPKRSTSGSAGYDFVNPFNIIELNTTNVEIPTGIKVQLDSDKILMLAPRSSSARNGYMFSNTLGIIDSDYYNNPTNEGCIRVSLKAMGTSHPIFDYGDKIAQGVILQYFTTEDDNATGKRTGGHGSTGK